MVDIFNKDVLNTIPEISAWLGMYARNSNDTMRRISREICVFFNIVGVKTIKDVENLKAEDVSKIYIASRENKWSNNTTNSYIGTAKLFYKWANYNNVIKPNNVLFNIKRLKNDAEPKYCPPKEDMQKILDAINKHTKKKRLKVMVRTCLLGGFRRSEVCNLKISDLMDREIRVYGKGSKVRMQMVNQELLNEIWDYINTDRKEDMQKYEKMGGKDLGYVFVSGIGDIDAYKEKKKDLLNGNKVSDNAFYVQIKGICEKANIDGSNKISVHTLRHFFGTTIYENTLDLALTQEAMRHSDLTTTRRYVHLSKARMQSALQSINI